MPARLPRKPASTLVLTLAALLGAGGLSTVGTTSATAAQPAAATGENPFEGRPISEVRFVGLKRVTDVFARNNVTTREGQPLDWRTVTDDLRRLERLGQFRGIKADVEPKADNSVVVIFTLTEAPIVRDIAWVGNTRLDDAEISKVVNDAVSLIRETPIDDYRIGQAQRGIEELYRSKGYYFVQVTVDESELESNQIITFRIREAERIKVTAIRFSGNTAYSSKQLRPQLKIKTAGIFNDGPLDDKLLDEDVASLVKYYRDRGYLDARAGREVQPSPDGKEAIVTFIVDEGRLYTLRNVIIRAAAANPDDKDPTLRIYTTEQLRGVMEIKPGDAYAARQVDAGVKAVRDAYHRLGYTDAQVKREELRDSNEPQVDIRLTIIEGGRFKTGIIDVQGNDLTQAKVIRREMQIAPDRWLDAAALRESQKELDETRLFGRNPVTGEGVKVTVQPEDAKYPGYRDVLVEVEETNTGNFSFGAGVTSDLGLFGLIQLQQRNFDIADTPDSFDEFIRGRAFRGAGQTFDISLSPGIQNSNYSISLTDPAIFESEYSLTGSAFFRDRELNDWDEQRYGTRWRLARRFGTRWTGGISLRGESVTIDNIDKNAAEDIVDVEGQNFLTSIGFDLQRTTTDSRFRPTRGTRTEFNFDQVGALGGDYTFSRVQVDHTVFLTIDETELGYKTILSMKTMAGYLFPEDEAPVFERFYLGGRSFRGFNYRSIGPTGINSRTGKEGNDHVGGDFMFFLGLEVEKPVYKDVVAIVGFIDTGTINNNFGFEDYRVSVGTGVRLYLPQFGQAPLAFDFAFPILKEDKDDTQLFSFSFDIPF